MKTAVMKLLTMAAAVIGLSGCSPTLNWREVRPPGSALTLLFPCKPDQFSRLLTLAGQPVEMGLMSCQADGATFAMSHADARDPARVGAALTELQRTAVGNLGGAAKGEGMFAVPGMTPNPASMRLETQGTRPDGLPVQAQVAVFAHGLRVYQATVFAEKLDAEAAEAFFSSMKFQN